MLLKNHRRGSLTCLFLFIACSCFAQGIKVIGYLPYYRMSAVENIEFHRLTHVNIAFANPDAAGNLSCAGVNVDGAITAAHNAGCKVFISLGGGALTPAWESAWDSLAQPSRRGAFIQKIINYVGEHRYDGVDMDLEWQYVKDWYSPFVLELKRALEPLGLPLTAALPGSHRYAHISDLALAAFDWVNMMAYDLTGPWDPSNPGQHSPIDWTAQCISYWKSQGLTKHQLTLGVPFYGYDFSTTPVSSLTYGRLVSMDVANAQRDSANGAYWNGIPTIKEKTRLAIEQTSGVMIWELGQDAFGTNAQLSLLRAIDERIREVTSHVDMYTIEVKGLARIYPNPAHDRITVSLAPKLVSDSEGATPVAARVVIRDIQGNEVYEKSVVGTEVEVPTILGLRGCTQFSCIQVHLCLQR